MGSLSSAPRAISLRPVLGRTAERGVSTKSLCPKLAMEECFEVGRIRSEDRFSTSPADMGTSGEAMRSFIGLDDTLRAWYEVDGTGGADIGV